VGGCGQDRDSGHCLAERIDVAVHTVADLDARASQIDARDCGRDSTRQDQRRLSAMEGERKAYAALVDERNREAGIR